MLTSILRTINACRICGSKKLTPLLSLGRLYVSDFLDKNDDFKGAKAPLDLVLCSEAEGGCGLLQLKDTVSDEVMYRTYWYRSGTNKTMTDELTSIARIAADLANLNSGDYVIDIGANDGTLLRNYPTENLNRVGFEPAKNLGQWNQKGTTKVFPDFFNYGAWHKELGEMKANAVTAIAMFYDLDEPNTFVGDVAKCLDIDRGVFIIQMSYLPLMLERNAFDNICHEHLGYYSLHSLEVLLSRHKLEVFDVELNEVNGGSFRIYMRHQGKGYALKIAPGAAERVQDLRAYEKKLGLSNQLIHEEFMNRVEKTKQDIYDFIKYEVEQGKKVYVYGASTKGNTLLQYFGLDSSLIEAAAERNPDKWGKKTIGTNIPIVSEEEARKAHPDYFLILPWHFLDEFQAREAEYLSKGGKFIVPLPEFKIIATPNAAESVT